MTSFRLLVVAALCFLGSTAVAQDARVSVHMDLKNVGSRPVEFFWLQGDREKRYGQIRPGGEVRQQTYSGHEWRFRVDGKVVREIVASTQPLQVYRIDSGSAPKAARPQPVSVHMDLKNTGSRPVEFFWLQKGREKRYGQIRPGGEIRQQTYSGHEWRFRVDGKAVREIVASTQPLQVYRIDSGSAPKPARPKSVSVSVDFVNVGSRPVDFYWLQGNQEKHYGRIRPGAQVRQQTYSGHAWRFRAGGEVVGEMLASTAPSQVFRVDSGADRFKDTPPEPIRVSVNFVNIGQRPVDVYWSKDGGEQHYGRIAPGATHRQPTYAGHTWRLRVDGEMVGSMTASSNAVQTYRVQSGARVSTNDPPTPRPPSPSPGEEPRPSPTGPGAGGPAPQATGDICWKDSYGRGAGTIPTGCGSYPDHVLEVGLCYARCADGFKGGATICAPPCPPSFIDNGLSCTKAGGYTRVGKEFPLHFGELDLKNAVRRCESAHGRGGCEQLGLIIYPKCDQGFRTSALECQPVCPRGMTDDGALTCWKNTYDRGVGKIPDRCPAGQENQAGLCYPHCAAGTSGVGPVCWSNRCTGAFPVDCGAACATSSAECANSIVKQTLSSAEVAVNVGLLVTTGGAANVGLKAAQASARATGRAVLSAASRQAAKKAYKSTLRNSATRRNLRMTDEVLDLAAESLVTSKEDGEFDFEAVDPTGVVAVVNAFNKPICGR